MKKIIEIKGFSDITTKKIVENIQEFKEFYDSINEIIDISHIIVINKVVKKTSKEENKDNYFSMNDEKIFGKMMLSSCSMVLVS